MAQRKNASRKKNLQKFKEKRMSDKAKQVAGPQQVKQIIAPVPEWQSNDFLEVRGDVLDQLNQNLQNAYDAIAKAGQALKFIFQHNIHNTKKVKLAYIWNNGERATPEEIEKWKADQETINGLKAAAAGQQAEALEKAIKQQQNAEKTGLVSPDGEPIGTDQDLDDTADEAGDINGAEQSDSQDAEVKSE